MKQIIRSLGCKIGLISILFFSGIEAASAITLQTIASNISHSLTLVAHMMQSVALISGIGFVLSSFFKFHQHKLNPQQVSISQGVTLLLIGSMLIMFPTLIPTFTSILTGSTGGTATIGGTGLVNLIGG